MCYERKGVCVCVCGLCVGWREEGLHFELATLEPLWKTLKEKILVPWRTKISTFVMMRSGMFFQGFLHHLPSTT